jgi:hypothetical protein
MDLIQYLQSSRIGKDAHNLERKSINNPFLYDAVEGFLVVDGDHIKSIKKLRKDISTASGIRNYSWLYWILTVCLLILLGYGAYWYSKDSSCKWISLFKKEKTVKILIPEDEKSITDIVQETEIIPETMIDTVIPEQVEEQIALPENESVKQQLPEKKKPQAQKNNALPNEDYLSEIDRQIAMRERNRSNLITNSTAPEPIVGASAYVSYLKRSVQTVLADEKICEGKRGKVVLLFNVNANGRPYKISVLRSLCAAADAQAIRIVTSGPSWTKGSEEVKLEVPFD